MYTPQKQCLVKEKVAEWQVKCDSICINLEQIQNTTDYCQKIRIEHENKMDLRLICEGSLINEAIKSNINNNCICYVILSFWGVF